MLETSKPLNVLLDQYMSLERRFPLVDVNHKYRELVRANTNQTFPVQRWFHFKEAYSLDLLEALLHDWSISSESVYRILDPFCGVGTTLMASQKMAKILKRDDIEAIGIERNPL